MREAITNRNEHRTRVTRKIFARFQSLLRSSIIYGSSGSDGSSGNDGSSGSSGNDGPPPWQLHILELLLVCDAG